jgi:6-phosphogluconolactonase
MAYVYVSNAASGELTVLRMAAHGELGLQASCDVGGSVAPMAFSPAHAMLHVAQRGEVNAIVSFSVQADTGGLTHRATTPLSAKMSNLTLDRTASCLIATSYHSHHLSVRKLNAQGVPVGPEQWLPTPLHPHSVQLSPSNRYALVACLGADVLQVHGFDALTGHVSTQPVSVWQARAGSGPRHFRFSPSGQQVYLLNELDASLDVLAWDEQEALLQHVQTVSTLPAGFSGRPWAADVHLTADGQWLMSTERSSSTLALFHVDRSSGALALAGHTLVETQPRAFAISTDGQQVLVAGQLSNHLACYRFDAQAGSLQLAQRVPTGAEPLWVEIVS